jgi:hypothetical protein
MAVSGADAQNPQKTKMKALNRDFHPDFRIYSPNFIAQMRRQAVELCKFVPCQNSPN